MKSIVRIVFFVCSCCFFAGYSVKAQNIQNSNDTVNLNADLPDLNFFLESAVKTSPLLNVSDKQISQIIEQIKKEKKSWTNCIVVDANAKYGIYNQLSVTDLSNASSNVIGVMSNSEKFNYFIGLTFALPISELTNKKNNLKILNDNLDEKKFQKESTKKQIEQLVIEEYYNLLFLNKSLKINQDILQAIIVSHLKSENDLKSGVIKLEEYNSVLIQKAKAEETFYKVQNEYLAQYMKLLNICGVNRNQLK